MKRKRGISLLSFWLTVMLILQTLTFAIPTYAESGINTAEGNVEDASAVTNEVIDGEDESINVDKTMDKEAGQTITPDTAKIVMPMTMGPADKTAVFMAANIPFPLKVEQGSPLAEIAPGGDIQGRQSFILKSEGLTVPVNGDDPNPTNADPEKYIQKGDWIELKREDYFKEVVLPTTNKILNAQTESGPKKLGTVQFTPNSIRIVFDGDDGFFNGVGRNIIFSFETTANSDVEGVGYGESKPIDIFGTTYQLVNPDVTPDYSMTISSPGMIQWDQYAYRGLQPSQFVEGIVTWESIVSASDKFDKTIQLPLDGKTFYTDLATYANNANNVPQSYGVKGIYVPGSFKVNNIEVTPTINGDVLSYIFPTGTGENPKVEYKVWIPKEGYYYEYRNPPGNLGRTHRVMLGRAELQQDGTKIVDATREIAFAPDWIQAVASYDHSSETITWTINVNSRYNKKGLKDFTITNVLPDGLEFKSATWQTWVDGVASTATSITPDANDVYSFGDIDGRVQLVIQSRVKNGSNFRIDPRANWNLDTPNGVQNNDVTNGVRPVAVTDEATVIVGAHTFTKSGAVSQEDFNLGGVTWTVNLAPQYALPDAVVYDVLVRGGDLGVLDHAVDATNEVDAATIAKIKANITVAQLWKQYHQGSLSSANGLNVKAIPLTVNGEVVADLIKVTGYTTDQNASFSFRALETKPDNLFRQDINIEKTKRNRALLFDGETVKTAENTVNLHVRMLNKDMLTASYPVNAAGVTDSWFIPNNIHRYLGYNAVSNTDEYTLAAYDRTTKTVTFRLSFNMPGYNTEELAKDGGNRVVSNIKLVDTLPEGWEFVPFENGQYYELYKGSSTNYSGTGFGILNTAQELIGLGTAAHVVTNFERNGEVGTFTFSKFESPYVILVKARPTNTALEQYLDEYVTSGTDKQVVYNKADLHMTWGAEEKVVTEQRKVIVPVRALSKSVNKPFPGVLEWTVDYTPPFNLAQGVYLQDTIGAGMKLRYDESGNPILTAPSMSVYPAKLTASGALEREGAALDLSAPNAEVQVEVAPGAGGTTVIEFHLSDPNKIYQFVYQTEVDKAQEPKAGDKMGNEVRLVGDDNLQTVSVKSETTLDSSDVAGSSTSNALLSLIKVDPDGNPLGDVCFELYQKSDGTKVAEGKTTSDGKRNLLFPDPGYYELVETCYDKDTYLPNTKVYQVYVGNTPGKPVWVDGVKVTSDDPLIVPTPAAGKLKIDNTVTGNGGDQNKDFNYTIVFNGEGESVEYEYIKDGAKATLKSGDSIILKHGEEITFPLLLEGLSYTVTQQSYTDDGYTTSPNTFIYSGVIEKDKTKELAFVNNRIVSGNLFIDNTVTGAGDQSKDFEYTINFADTGASESYEYTKPDGTTGTIKSGDKILLKHGQSATINNLPVGLTYTVEQTDYANEDYTTEPSSLTFTGPIEESTTAEAKFVNHKDAPGSLVVSNTVMGNGSDANKEFEYKVIFTGLGANRTYNYTKSDGTTGTIESGDTFTLKHGEKITIEGIIKDTGYVVTEEDYTSEYYTTNPTSREYTGTIEVGTIAEAPFENARYLPGTLALEPKEQKVRGNGEVPVDLTATLTGEDGRPVEGEEITFIVDGVEVGKAITDENGKATITYQPPKLTEETPKEHDVVATTKATSPSGQPYNEDDATAKVITMPAALTGVLRDNETGLVIPDAEIQVKNVKTGEVTVIKTDEEGRYYHLVQRDEEYTITYNRTIMINGVPTSIPFTQKAFIEDKDAAPVEGNLIPAEITAVGIVLLQQPNGNKSLLNEAFAGKLHIYLKDASGNYVSENGVPKAFPVEDNGTFLAEGLTTGTYLMEVRYEFEPGKELTLFKDKALNLTANGELNISEELVDPYGTVYDETTGDANTGKKIEGATVTLYYADTPRNRAKGIVPGTKVVLPAIPGFAPNDNASPEQLSDLYGFYAYMVFPEADYYLVVTKEGYETYTSPTISVEWDIVRHDVPMKPISSGGNPGGNPDPGTNPGNPGGNPNPGTNPGNPGSNPNPGTNPSKPDVEETSEQPEGNPDSEEMTEEPEGNPDTEEITEQPESNPGSGETTEESVEQPEANEQQENNQPQKNNEAKQENKLDNVPKTGDDSLSPLFYMALALMSSIMLGLLLLSNRKKKHI